MQINSYDLRAPEKKFRPELEGVRVVASFLVAIYHIWLGAVSGGVDVFFIVSGYLITTSVLYRFEKNGSFQYSNYLLNLGKRLYPQAFIVLIFSAICSFLLLPKVQWKQIISEIYSSAFYFQNWQLATNAVDYLAQNNEASPLQHFWALSVQGQFYLIWPLVIFIAFVLARKIFKTPFRKTLLALLTTIFIISITYSIYITKVNQPWAYFDTFARVWEFSLGGILALLIPYFKPNKFISFMIGWLGLAIIVFTGILLPVSTVFPGYAALLPITGVVLIIISAENSAMLGVQKILGSKSFLYFGGISYGFYLWHWPLLIFYLAIFKTDSVPIIDGFIIIFIAIILSILSTNVMEAPIRGLSLQSAKRKIVFVLLLFTSSIIIVNTTWNFYMERIEKDFQQQVNLDDYPGARVLYDNVEAKPGIEPILAPPQAENILPTFYADNCFIDMNGRGLKKCSYGDTTNPEYTIALVGGSRTGHWFPAFEQFAEDLHLQIDVYNKDGCRFSTDDFNGKLSDSCMEWNDLVVEELMKNPPDILFATADVYGDDSVPKGYIEMFNKFSDVTKIFAIRNNPTMSENIPLCVEVNGIDKCKEPRNEVLSEVPPWENTAGLPDNIYFADLSDYFCDEDYCYPVIGNVFVYRDRAHISTLYAMTLAEPLKEHIIIVLEQLESERKNTNH